MSMMCLLMTMMVAVSSSPLMAQESLTPPKSREASNGSVYLIIALAVLLTGGVVFATTLKSKRSEQD